MAGVIFVVCIPSANFEQVLTFGKPINSQHGYEFNEKHGNQSNIKLELESRSEKSSIIPMHFTQSYYNDTFQRNESDIGTEKEIIPMEKILQELLSKLEIEYTAWNSDTTGNYLEVIFPVQTGVPCENMLHCLTQLGIGKKFKSIINVLPCSVVHSAIHNAETEEETYLRSDEEKKRWKSFVNSIRSKLTVKQVVDGVRSGGEMSFDYLALIVTADSLAALGLIENNSSNIVAAMLVSPLMGPVMSVTFGAIIADKELIRSGFFSLFIGMIASCVFGFIFGLIVGSTEMPWGFGDWPTEEMKSRGNVRSLWMGVLWALTSGTGVAIALLQGSAGPLIGVAISASLLPPIVNCGLFWALACIWLLHKDIKIPHITGEKYHGNSSYKPIYHDYIPIEFAINGLVSACLTIVNVICIFITAIILLKIKEVAAPYTSSPDLRRFWHQDIRVVREENRNNMKATEESERREYMMQELPNLASEGKEEKLIAAINEAVDDDTFRKVQRISYQSHTIDENTFCRKIGLLSSSKQSSMSSTPYSSYVSPRSNNYDEMAALDKLLTLLLQLQPNESLPLQHLSAHSKIARSRHNSTLSTASSSILPTIVEDVNYRKKPTQKNSNSWSDRANDNSLIQTVLSNLHSEPGSLIDEPFLAAKNHHQSN